MKYKKTLFLVVLFLFMYGAGAGAAKIVDVFSSSNFMKNETENWGLGFGTEGTAPTGNVSAEELKEDNAYYVGDTSQKTIYLTFDCGYENGHTKKILEALRTTNTKAIFFITGHYLTSATDLVLEMIKDGHLIGNHTYSHKDFTKSTNEEILKDIEKLENKFYDLTNTKMSKYVRPPRGEFDERSLKLLMDNGYHSVFWSLAYVDWNQHTFNGNQYSYRQVMKRIHNGAIILMHTVSKDNAEDLESIIMKLKNDGYNFNSIENVL